MFYSMEAIARPLFCRVFVTFFLAVLSAKGFLIPEGVETVDTRHGTIRGELNTVHFENHNYKVRTFLGIPYAEPPVGNLRLQKPVPISTFKNSHLNAYSYGPACPSYPNPHIPQSEDCLTLNIFAPSNLDDMKLTDLPVMVWIHGGAFVAGTSRPFDGSYLSAYTGVIVVTMNYRLGPLGFFSFENDVASGNYGLWDQHLAIKWVRDNIANFGGNPDSISIFGESAGSISVIYQLAYAGNGGIFKRAIAESGTINSLTIGIKVDTSKASKRFAGQFNCNSSSEVEILSCLRSVSQDDIMNTTQDEMIAFRNNEVHPRWMPVYDNSFVPAEISTLIENMTKFPDRFPVFVNTDLMIGSNNYDGLLYFDTYRRLINATSVTDLKITTGEFKDICVPKLAEVFFRRPVAPLTKQAIIEDYTDWNDPTNATRRLDELARMTTDAVLKVPTVLTADAHVGGKSKTYLYQFAASPAYHNYAPFQVPSLLESQYTSSHADEIAFVFGTNQRVPNATVTQMNLTKSVMTMWSNFAKSGDPNSPVPIGDEYQGVTWPAYDKTSQEYLQISPTMSPQSVKSHLAAKAVNLWNVLLPKIQQSAESGTHQSV